MVAVEEAQGQSGGIWALKNDKQLHLSGVQFYASMYHLADFM